MIDNEAARLRELHRYNVLFTDPEVAFDRITDLAKRLFGVPIVLISLVDKDFQWFKSCIGLDISRTPREVSFCQYSLTEVRPFVVSDACADFRFSQNPLVTGPPGIRFYAGAPLISPRGYGLGALCLIDTVPRPDGLSDRQEQTLMDLSRIVVSELELRSANEILRSLRVELERSNADLANFAHVVSHDLQTPTRTIMSFTELLKRRLNERLDDDEKLNFELIVAAAKRMNELTSGLLATAQVGQTSMAVQDVSMEDLVSGVIADLDLTIKESGAEVCKDSLPVIECDRMQISRLFLNLISNALKYRSPKRPARIKISSIAREEHWEILVRDNGVGIDEKFQNKIFEPLTRLHGDEIPGSGLGLAICSSIAERHGGWISVKSIPDVGSTFSVFLPISVA